MSKTNYSSLMSNNNTPQTEALLGRETEMEQNNAGGYTFVLGQKERLRRFLILGAASGTYYVDAKANLTDNYTNVMIPAMENLEVTLEEIKTVSVKGLAQKNDHAIFALACIFAKMATFSEKYTAKQRELAIATFLEVCRIPTHMFMFIDNVIAIRGKKSVGRFLRKAIESWYGSKSLKDLAFYTMKYQSREGWTHKDVIRLGHVCSSKTITDPDKKSFIGYLAGKVSLDAVKNKEVVDYMTSIIYTLSEATNRTKKIKDTIDLIEKHNLSHEMIHNELCDSPEIWKALLKKAPLGAVIRSLARITGTGTFEKYPEIIDEIGVNLNDAAYIAKSRLHPLSILTSLYQYKQGRGMKSAATWTVIPKFVKYLDNAFYKSMETAPKTGKRFYIGVDVSGSMGWESSSGSPLTCAMVAAAISAIIANTENTVHVYGFAGDSRSSRSTYMREIDTVGRRLDDILKTTSEMTFGSTDCALPILHANDNNMDVDVFITITDNETYYGTTHPTVALKQYRNKVGHQVKNIVIGLTPTRFTINDPTDKDGLDIAGFSPDLMSVVTNFVNNEF